MPIVFAGGLGGTSGSIYSTAPLSLADGQVWYIDFTNGVDSASSGTNREQPLKTLAQAIANSSSGDVIVALSGHSETLTSAQTLTGRYLIGEGTGTNQPTFIRDSSNSALIWGAGYGGMSNIKVAASVSTSAFNANVTVSGDGFIHDCTFVGGDADDGALLSLNHAGTANHVLLKNCTFTSAATAKSTAPLQAIIVESVMDVFLDNVTIDGGTYGWSEPSAFETTAAATIFGTVSIVHGSDIKFATNTDGFLSILTSDSSSHINWA